VTAETLSPQVRELFAELAHAGEPLPPREGEQLLRGEAGQERLGTRVRFLLRVANGRVLEARYRAYGCPHTLAACEWLARALESSRLGTYSAKELWAGIGGPLDWVERLEIPSGKLGRLLVVEDALRAALGAAADDSVTNR
jgi:hypothetical protein